MNISNPQELIQDTVWYIKKGQIITLSFFDADSIVDIFVNCKCHFCFCTSKLNPLVSSDISLEGSEIHAKCLKGCVGLIGEFVLLFVQSTIGGLCSKSDDLPVATALRPIILDPRYFLRQRPIDPVKSRCRGDFHTICYMYVMGELEPTIRKTKVLNILGSTGANLRNPHSCLLNGLNYRIPKENDMFYQLSSPSYSTDMAASRAYPIECVDSVSLPGIHCPECDDLWAGSEHIRTNLTVSKRVLEIIRGLKLPRFGVPLEQFQSVCREISMETGIPLELLRPGTDICPPQGTIRNSLLHDFIHPFPGMFWINHRVKAVIEGSNLKGVSFAKVNVNWAGKMKDSPEELPDFWEIVVTGKAWRQGSDLQTITACSFCGRTAFLRGGTHLTVDESRWDTSDFFHVDQNPNIVIVTDKVTEILNQGNFTNYVCNPV